MLNLDILKNICIIAIAGGCITTLLVQKTKELLNTKKWLGLISFLISMIFGTLFALTFSNVSIIHALWIGLFTFIGADVIYKTLEDKVFASFTSINDTKDELTDDPLEEEGDG